MGEGETGQENMGPFIPTGTSKGGHMSGGCGPWTMGHVAMVGNRWAMRSWLPLRGYAGAKGGRYFEHCLGEPLESLLPGDQHEVGGWEDKLELNRHRNSRLTLSDGHVEETVCAIP